MLRVITDFLSLISCLKEGVHSIFLKDESIHPLKPEPRVFPSETYRKVSLHEARGLW
jgi:hypothetical protein